MKRRTPIATVLYNYLFPNPKPNDPTCFTAHLNQNLVPEVRVEVATFYGDLNSAEARYPGLNYCHPAHRMRLGRFKHHRRLFEAFDSLGLTDTEIQGFCCWEGTLWARERYEKDEGYKVCDTTGNDILPWVDRRGRVEEDHRRSITRKTDISVVVEQAMPMVTSSALDEDDEMSDSDAEAEDEATDFQRPVDGPIPQLSPEVDQLMKDQDGEELDSNTGPNLYRRHNNSSTTLAA